MPDRAMRIGLIIGMLFALMIPGRSQAQLPTEGEGDLDGPKRVDASTVAGTSTTSAIGTTTGTVAEQPWPEEPPEELPPEEPPPREAETSTTGLPSGVAPAEPLRIGEIELPQKLGPAWIDAGVGRVRLGLTTQLRVELLSLDEPDGRDTRVGVLVRRLRTTLSGRFLDDRFTFAVQLNTTAGNFELVDVWIGMEFLRYLRVRFGQFKIPFDWYRQQSFTRLLMADWSLTTEWYGAERQFGIMVHDDASGPGIDYAFGVFTGQNRRAGHAFRLPELYGEPVRNPSRVDGVGEVDAVHPELVGTIRYTTPGFSDSSISDRRGGPPRGMMAVGATFDAEPRDGRDFRARWTSEAWLKAHHVSLVALGYLGLVDAATRDRLILGAGGVNLQAGYRFLPQMEIAARYAWVQLTQALSDDARDRGQSIIDGATPEERDELEVQYGNAGALRWEQELLGGFTFFFVGHSLKWQLDLGWLHQSFRERSQNDLRVRTHIQLAF